MKPYTEFRGVSRIRPLDGLRAVAITLLFTAHLHNQALWGRISHGAGVSVFFVISGFIITTLLLREADAGTVRLGAFYVRRLFRIAPLYYTVFLAYVAMIFVAGIQQDRAGLFLAATPGYLFGFPEVVQLMPPATPPPFYLAWSVGIEEKFYLIWPIILVVLFRGRWRAIAGFLASAVLALSIIGYGQPLSRVLQPYTAIIFGTGLAMLLHQRASYERVGKLLGRRWVTAALSATTIGCLFLPGIYLGEALYVPFGLLVAITLASILTVRTSGVVTLLSSRPMRFLGLVSLETPGRSLGTPR